VQPTEQKTIPDMSIGDILLFMQKCLPLDEQGFPQELLFTSLELIDSEKPGIVSLVLTARKS